MISATALFALGASLPSVASAAPGDLDPTFGGGGISFMPSQYEALDTALLDNGKIVVGGQDLLAPYPEGAGIVARYRADGSLDASFGMDGVASTPPRALLACEAMVVTPDGKTVCAYTDGSGNEGVVARFRRGGVLDRSFGEDGIAIADRTKTFFSVAVQADGRILAGSPGVPRPAQIARFTIDGALDPTFAGDGVLGAVRDRRGDPRVDGRPIAVQPNGKILATTTGRWWREIPRLVRLRPDGTPDSSFGREGVSARLGVSGASIYDIAVQPDGAIVVVGSIGGLWLVARYNSDGTLDRSFGDAGVVVSKQGGNPSGIGILPDGRIAVGGGNFKLLVYRPDGTLDPTFGTDGRARAKVGVSSQGSGAYALVVQPDGKVVLVGNAVEAGTLERGIALVRFLT